MNTIADIFMLFSVSNEVINCYFNEIWIVYLVFSEHAVSCVVFIRG